MIGISSARSYRRLGEKDPISRQEQHRTPEKFECESPAASLPFSSAQRPRHADQLHPPPSSTPSNDNYPEHRQHAWCLRPRCRGRQVHQRLRRLLEASGQAANPRSVSTSTQIEKKKRWTNQQYGHEDEHEHTPYAICYATSRGP